MGNKGTPGAYILKHKASGYYFIGSSSDVDRRTYVHKWSLTASRHFNAKLQAAYSAEPVIEIIKFPTATREKAYDVAQRLLNRNYGSLLCLNVSKDARSPLKGVRLSEETRKKISAASKGRQISEANRAAISAYHTGRPKSPEQIEKMRLAKLGIKHSAEHNEKIRQSAMMNRRACKPVTIEGTAYQSIGEAVLAAGLSRKTIRARIDSTSEKFKAWTFSQAKNNAAALSAAA